MAITVPTVLSAWIWRFSSRLRTIAFSGGLKHRPATSTSWCSKRGSRESVKDILQVWLALRRYTRRMVVSFRPKCAASVRVLQCVTALSARRLAVVP